MNHLMNRWLYGEMSKWELKSMDSSINQWTNEYIKISFLQENR